jgi:hypothetical protein
VPASEESKLRLIAKRKTAAVERGTPRPPIPAAGSAATHPCMGGWVGRRDSVPKVRRLAYTAAGPPRRRGPRRRVYPRRGAAPAGPSWLAAHRGRWGCERLTGVGVQAVDVLADASFRTLLEQLPAQERPYANDVRAAMTAARTQRNAYAVLLSGVVSDTNRDDYMEMYRFIK